MKPSEVRLLQTPILVYLKFVKRVILKRIIRYYRLYIHHSISRHTYSDRLKIISIYFSRAKIMAYYIWLN